MVSIINSISIIIVGVILYYYYFSTNYITITTKYGAIKGFSSNSRDGRNFYSFLGIPYAEPPVGKYRFQATVSKRPWKDVHDGTVMGPLCPQFDNFLKQIDGQEDCLHLNIFTPKKFVNGQIDEKKLLPVIVFFHGGGYMYGGSNIFGAEYFMDEDVVIVTLNYRLGALGFLNIGSKARGNMGMKDQVMGLKWIQDAISDFGGDPNLVTIMGWSAGGSSVHYHMMSPMSQGLFHRAISHSGTAFCPWAFVENTTQQALQLGRRVNCPTERVEDLTECLMNIDFRKIIETQRWPVIWQIQPLSLYGPSAEFSSNDDVTFLSSNPNDVATVRKLAPVPWILGVVSEEGCYSAAAMESGNSYVEAYDNWSKIVQLMTMEYYRDESYYMKIRDFYFGKEKKNFSKEDYWTFTKMFTDRHFRGCTHDAAIQHSKNAPTFLYEMNYKTGIGLAHVLSTAENPSYFPILTLLKILFEFGKIKIYQTIGWELRDYGVCHSDDLQHLFKTYSILGIPKDSPHYEFSKSFVKLWVSFAASGKPEKFLGVEWKNSKADKEPEYFLIGKEPKMIHGSSILDRIKFWKSL